MIRELFLKGGILMYPLLLFSLISAAVIAEKISGLCRIMIKGSVFTAITARSGKKDLNGIAELAGRVISGSKRCAKDNASLELIKKTALGVFKTENDYKSEISALALSSSEKIHLLDLVGKISPMTGLTGTVIGLAKAFQSVSASGRTGDAALLAGGIWEAMITTIAGLLIAIPAIIAAHLLRNSFRKHIERLKLCCDAVFTAAGIENQ
ncbi:MAG: MotA/TolQ/ExbB proton channel family protein [Spirochaetia bacterium]|jgi:biopolymer transport protein ExbB|nr:MotA/TolQ/ExbB proton channel family protein [Spirochaetia bacterium]